jgi:hypothetical protein
MPVLPGMSTQGMHDPFPDSPADALIGSLFDGLARLARSIGKR